MSKKRLRIALRVCLAWLALLLFTLAKPSVALAAAPIVIDGNFGDWIGQTCIPDPPNDADGPQTDLLNLCFANNPNDPTAYFMVQRVSSNKPLDLWLYVDTNNNGGYTESSDRRIYIRYNPQGGSSSVQVDLYTGTGQYLSNIANGLDWGESASEGGRQVELGVTFADLGIAVGQPIRMYVESMQGSKVSDGTVEVQWSPADALGLALLGGVLLSGSVWFGVRRSRSGNHG